MIGQKKKINPTRSNEIRAGYGVSSEFISFAIFENLFRENLFHLISIVYKHFLTTYEL